MNPETCYLRWATAFYEDETLIAKENLERATRGISARLDPISTVRAVYADKLESKQHHHGYSERGHLQPSLLVHKKTVKELFPVDSVDSLRSLTGVGPQSLQWLGKNKLILLLIQRPELYADLDFLHEIVRNRDYVACYEARDKVIYEYLSGGLYDDFIAAARGHKIFGSTVDFPEELLEPYERLMSREPVRTGTRNAQRYAALASVMGYEALEEALSLPTRIDPDSDAVHGVLARFYYLHRRLLHPISQGIGGLPYSTSGVGLPAESPAERGLAEHIESSLFDEVFIDLPDEITPDLVSKIQATSIPDRFEKLELALISLAGTDDAGMLKTANDVTETLRSLEDSVRNARERDSRRTQAGFRIVCIGGSVALSRDYPEMGALSAGLAGLVPKRAFEVVVDVISRVFRREALPWQYWRLKERVGRELGS